MRKRVNFFFVVMLIFLGGCSSKPDHPGFYYKDKGLTELKFYEWQTRQVGWKNESGLANTEKLKLTDLTVVQKQPIFIVMTSKPVSESAFRLYSRAYSRGVQKMWRGIIPIIPIEVKKLDENIFEIKPTQMLTSGAYHLAQDDENLGCLFRVP